MAAEIVGRGTPGFVLKGDSGKSRQRRTKTGKDLEVLWNPETSLHRSQKKVKTYLLHNKKQKPVERSPNQVLPIMFAGYWLLVIVLVIGAQIVRCSQLMAPVHGSVKILHDGC